MKRIRDNIAGLIILLYVLIASIVIGVSDFINHKPPQSPNLAYEKEVIYLMSYEALMCNSEKLAYPCLVKEKQ